MKYLFCILICAASVFALPGDIDSTFGTAGGYLITDFASMQFDERPHDVAVQPDGKIVVVGQRYQGTISGFFDFLAARFNADGSLDTTFSDDGYFIYGTGGQYGAANAVAIQPDGKILIAGNGDEAAVSAYALRLNTDGSFDTTFSGDGIETVANTGQALAMVLQSDGKILIATNSNGGFFPVNYRSVLARLNPDGTLDTTFDADGRVTLNPGVFLPFGLALQADGKIVVAGANTSGATLRDIALARINTNGTFDTTFDSDGIVHTILPGQEGVALAVAIQSDGKIVVGGATSAPSTTTWYDPTLIRYNTDGSLDTTFDADGVRSFELLGNNESNYFNDVSIQADGRILAISDRTGTFNFFVRDDFFIVRVATDGSSDATFDSNGIVKSQWCENGGEVALQTDGKIVAVGSRDRVAATTDHGICIQRFAANGAVDYSFNPTAPTGKATLSAYDLTGVNAIAGLSDGKILVAGDAESLTSGVDEGRLMRLNSDGTLDTSFMSEGTYGRSSSTTVSFNDLKVMPDGSFWLVGESGTSGGLVAKFTAAGTLDTSFSGDGIATTTAISRFYGIAIQTDGKVIACGSTGSTTRGGRIARFSATGTLELTATNNLGTTGTNEILECGIQSDGKIVVAGYAVDTVNGDDRVAISRSLTTLAIDTSFGTGGVTAVDMSPLLDDRAVDMLVQADNKIVVASTGIGTGGDRDFAILRFDASGILDNALADAFGSGGVSLVNFGLTNPNDEARAILIQPDGQYLAGGFTDNGGVRRFAITKLNPGGSPALGFGTLGRAITGFSGDDARIEALGFYLNNRVLAAGKAWNGTDYDFAIARYENEVIPTAAVVPISGRVMTADGHGVRNAVVSLAGKDGEQRTVVTGSFGYFRFDDVAVGQDYVISVQSKRFTFDSPAQIVSVDAEISGISFIAQQN